MIEELGAKMRGFFGGINKFVSLRSWGIWFMSSFILTFLVETIHHFSIEKGFSFLKDYPFSFYLNFLIISLTLQVKVVTRRKYLVLTIVSMIWVFLSFGNGVITQFRGTPFMFSDFFLIQEGLSVAGSYLNKEIIICLVLGLIGTAWLLVKTVKIKIKPKKIDYLLFVCYSVFVIVSLFLAHTQSWLVPINWDYKTSYSQQGFPYSFLNTIYPYLSQGVDGYNEENIAKIKSSLSIKKDDIVVKPNIIYLQLESFMDPMEFEGVEYSFDPIPTFRALYEELGGRMNAPTYGGGTVRTEFEVLTGMDLDLMKPGEIPNNQILRTTAVESIASYLSMNDYHATAIHNFQGTFYSRDKVYGNLGFDVFIPVEFMESETLVQYVTQTDDSMLVDYVIKSLEQTEDERDFIFAVSTGPHGPYETREGYEKHPLQVIEIEDESHKASLQDMIIRYWNLDNQLKRLVEYINTLEEETILVAYSDHYPIISILDDENYFKNNDKYSVQYAIYSNFELEPLQVEEEIEAYQLSTYVYDLIGMNGGVMNEVHQAYANHEDYLKIKELIQYDLLQGKKYWYEPSEAPSNKKIQLGLNEIQPKEVFITGTTLIVNGVNFNPSTYIWVNGERMVKPSFLATTQLAIDLTSTNIKTMDDLVTVEIGQVGRYDKRIGDLMEVPLLK